MKILFVSSECAPFSKSGGLADVAFSLPPALQAEGNEIAAITPLYRCVKERFGQELRRVKESSVSLNGTGDSCALWRGENHGVPVWFVENDPFFDRPKLYGYDDDKLRFAWFCRAVIDLMDGLDFFPEILHCNDWETALAIIYLKNDAVFRSELKKVKRQEAPLQTLPALGNKTTTAQDAPLKTSEKEEKAVPEAEDKKKQ